MPKYIWAGGISVKHLAIGSAGKGMALEEL